MGEFVKLDRTGLGYVERKELVDAFLASAQVAAVLQLPVQNRPDGTVDTVETVIASIGDTTDDKASAVLSWKQVEAYFWPSSNVAAEQLEATETQGSTRAAEVKAVPGSTTAELYTHDVGTDKVWAKDAKQDAGPMSEPTLEPETKLDSSDPSTVIAMEKHGTNLTERPGAEFANARAGKHTEELEGEPVPDKPASERVQLAADSMSPAAQLVGGRAERAAELAEHLPAERVEQPAKQQPEQRVVK